MNPLKRPSSSSHSKAKKCGRLLVQVHEATDFPVPSNFDIGNNPKLVVKVGSTSSYDVFPRKIASSSNVATSTFSWKGRVKVDTTYKLSFELFDEGSLVGSAIVRYKKLHRGETTETWYDLEPTGRIRVTLQALTFGKIMKPVTHQQAFFSFAKLKRAFPLKSDRPGEPGADREPVPLVEYNEKDISRTLPHIASGASGVVYKGYVKNREDLVAIKDIPVTGPHLFEEWKNEVDFMRENPHPYIVAVYGFCVGTARTLTIIMEYMNSGALYEFLHEEDNELEVLDRVQMARQVSSSLAYLHAHKVMHRDVKSLNFLVNSKMVCKLTDFGTAKLTHATTSHHTERKGTPLWMAPEVRDGLHYGLAADVFSLGVVLYEIFAQELPEYNEQTEDLEFITTPYLGCNLVENCVEMDPYIRPSTQVVSDFLTEMLYFIKDEREDFLAFTKEGFDHRSKFSSNRLDTSNFPTSKSLIQKRCAKAMNLFGDFADLREPAVPTDILASPSVPRHDLPAIDTSSADREPRSRRSHSRSSHSPSPSPSVSPPPSPAPSPKPQPTSPSTLPSRPWLLPGGNSPSSPTSSNNSQPSSPTMSASPPSSYSSQSKSSPGFMSASVLQQSRSSLSKTPPAPSSSSPSHSRSHSVASQNSVESELSQRFRRESEKRRNSRTGSLGSDSGEGYRPPSRIAQSSGGVPTRAPALPRSSTHTYIQHGPHNTSAGTNPITGLPKRRSDSKPLPRPPRPSHNPASLTQSHSPVPTHKDQLLSSPPPLPFRPIHSSVQEAPPPLPARHQVGGAPPPLPQRPASNSTPTYPVSNYPVSGQAPPLPTRPSASQHASQPLTNSNNPFRNHHPSPSPQVFHPAPTPAVHAPSQMFHSAPIAPAPQLSAQHHCRMLFDFVPENPGELLVSAGVILAVRTVSGIWLEGTTPDSRTGWVPLNYTQRLS